MAASKSGPDGDAPVLRALTAFFNTHSHIPAWQVAFSGGLDSTVLLHAMTRMRDRYGFQLRAAHVHHGLQAAADDWLEHCRHLADAWGVPLLIHSVQVSAAGHGLEAAAREARYRALADGLVPGERLLTAHHRDDQAETVLLNLLRGAGVQGLAGMGEMTRVRMGETPLWIGRPLLSVDRAALEAYARAHDLVWCEDPSNADTSLRRNWIRHELLPQLAAFQPAVVEKLSQTAEALQEAQSLLDELADACLEDVEVDGGLSIPALQALEGRRHRLVLRRWFARQGVVLTRNHLKALDELIHAAADRQPRVRIGRFHAARWEGRLIWPLRVVPPWQAVSWAERARLPWFRFSGVAPDGARLVPFAGTGLGLKPLKKAFRQAGVPPWDRPRWPVLMVEGMPQAVVGVRALHPAAPAVTVAFIAEQGAIG